MIARAPASRFLFVSFAERAGPWRRRLAGLVVAVAFLGALSRRVARVVLDRWWFDTVTDAPVWRTNLVAEVQLTIGTAAVTALLVGSSVWFVFRVARVTPPSPNPVIERYHQRMGPAHRWLLVGLAAYLSYHIGTAATDRWQLWLLFRDGPDLGRAAPVDGRDLGFHLFRLPFLAAASSFMRQLTWLTVLVSAFGHLMSGALRIGRSPDPTQRRSRRLAVAHLAALISFACALQALHAVYVALPSVATNRIGTFDGPGWTERFVTRPGLFALAFLAAAVGYAAVWLARTGRWRPFVATVGVYAVAHVAVVVVLPVAAERFVVAPAEAERQLWSIENNLAATREAFGLDRFVVDGVPLDEVATGPLSGEEDDDLARIALFDTPSMAPALQVLAGTTGTRIVDVDLERYAVDGSVVPVFVAARSARRSDVPETGWVQDHLVYTHGDGVVVVPADRVDADARPDVQELAGAFDVDHDPLYFGEGLDGWYSIVGTRRVQQGDAVFAGRGIAMSSFGQRLVLALAAGETQPLLTSELTAGSELLYRRSVRERVGALAPFLALDGDPYPVIDDGRVVWIVDGYTTSGSFPASQFVSVTGVPDGSGLSGRSVNYLRAAVKATVEAETGETHLYRVDEGDDPVLDAWSDIYPGLLEPMGDVPPSIARSVRYPDDLWTVQSSLIGRYHVDSPEALFNGTERWSVSSAAAVAVGEPTTAPSPPVDMFSPLASGDGDGFVTVRPLGPGTGSDATTRDELSAVAVADHGLGAPVRLVVPERDGRLPLLSPQVAQSAIDADPEFARIITLLNANGSKVQFGPMTPVVASGALVWVRPIIVAGTGSSAAPRLFGVAAVADGKVGVRDDTRDAVAAALDPDAPTIGDDVDAAVGDG